MVNHHKLLLAGAVVVGVLSVAPAWAAVSSAKPDRREGSESTKPRTLSPARVQVSADEFTLTLSRPSIKRGPAIVELVNYGEDDHDLALRRTARGARTFRIGTVLPGRTGELERSLLPGRYRLWCTLADHAARGMRATLVVRAT